MSPIIFCMIQFVLSVTEVYISYLYIHSLCKTPRKASRFLFFTSYTVLGIVLFANNYISRPDSERGLAICLILTTLSILWVVLQYQGHIAYRIFVGISLMLLWIASELITYSLTSIFFDAINLEMFRDYSLLSFLSELIMYALVFLINCMFKQYTVQLTRKQSHFVLYAIIVSFVVLLRISGLSGNSRNTAVINIFIYAVIVLSNLLLHKLLIHLTKMHEQSLKEGVLLEQLNMQEARYRTAVASFKQVRSLTHDMHSHNIYLHDCLKTGRYQEAQAFLDELLCRSPVAMPLSTGNLSIDALINHYSALCSENAIHFTPLINVDISQIPLNNIEMNVVLGNLLDNALRHALSVSSEDDPFIEIHLEMTQAALILLCKNSFNPGHSSKDINILGGCGLSNVEDSIRMHSGILTVESTSSVFETTVSIPYHTT